MTKKIIYGPNNNEIAKISSLSDEIRFIQCMRLYKSHETIEELENALKLKAKLKMKNIF